MEKECTIERVREMLIEIVKDRECPLCGNIIYRSSKYSNIMALFIGEAEEGLDEAGEGFLNKHLPFIEDDGNAITAGIICGYKNLQRLTLLRCVKGSGRASDRTEIY